MVKLHSSHSNRPASASKKNKMASHHNNGHGNNSKQTWTLMILVATIINLAIHILSSSSQQSCPLAQLQQQAMVSDPVTSSLRAYSGQFQNLLHKEMQALLPPEQGGGRGGTNDNTKGNTTNNNQNQGVGISVASDAAPPIIAVDKCETEYERVTAHRTPGLTPEDLTRAMTYSGNRQRLANLIQKLEKGQRVTGIVNGGSISMGHGVKNHLRYSARLESWFNQNWPRPSNEKPHQVINRGSHGADICAMAKRLNLMREYSPPEVDLFVLEFAVNDYQGQDHRIQIDFKMDVFYEGFERIAMCTETVIYRLMKLYPNAAIVFLEMRSAVLARKTASLLHMGAAQHYQIPVLSYDQMMWPDYTHLLQLLKPYNYSAPIGDSVLPYPHGCHPCHREHMLDANKKCAHVCRIQQFAEQPIPVCDPVPPGREPCYVTMFSHDEVHPSGEGHQMAADLIAEWIATAQRDVCHRPHAIMPTTMPDKGWMVGQPARLEAESNFLMVNDTYEVFVQRRQLEALSHTPGFSNYDDRFGRAGWIATNDAGGESITFEIKFPTGYCYIPYLAVVKSYENMGTFSVTVKDMMTQQETRHEVDGQWKPRISVPHDMQLIPDDGSNHGLGGCTGHCQITVKTNPKIPDRKGNKVKIVTLSVRKCIHGTI